MKLCSRLYDHRIESINILIEMSIEEYIAFAGNILDKNELQRKRVRASKSIYSLLKSDLERGCVIPPISLALPSTPTGGDQCADDFLLNFVEQNVSDLVILDGLQRTYTILDMITEVSSRGDPERTAKALSTKLRAEIYVGINRLGVLYRMLTLNTGQSPMSLRQQIEMLYVDYLKNQINGIEIIRESEGRRITRQNQYAFSDVIDGFVSYIQRDETPLDRADILDNIKNLEKVGNENLEKDLFSDFISTWHSLILKIGTIFGESTLSREFIEYRGIPFGDNATDVFKKPQAIAGFGSALAKMRDKGILNDFSAAAKVIENISANDPEQCLEQINTHMAWYKNNATKIGNAQRGYFHYIFRELLNPDSDSYLSIDSAIDSGKRKYDAQA